MISEYTIKALNAPINDLKSGVKAVQSGNDPEAIHDTRVAIRRIRSILREMRGLFDRYYLDKIRMDLRNVFNQTGKLRDHEVANQLFSSFTVPDDFKEEQNTLLINSKKKEEELKSFLIDYLISHSIDNIIKILRAVLVLPVKENKNVPAEMFAFKKINKIRNRIIILSDTVIKNKFANAASSYHPLRILCKRLRYNIEFFRKVLPPTYRNIEKYAKKIQNLLGDLHDIDMFSANFQELNNAGSELKTFIENDIVQRREILLSQVIKQLENIAKKI